MKRKSSSKKSKKGSLVVKKKQSSSAAAGGWGDNYRSVSRGVYSNNKTYYFRRPMEDAVLYCSGAATVAQLGPTGSAVPWLALGNLTADVGAGVLSQFGAAINVNLAQVAGYTDFSGLFNRFRVEKLEITVENTNGDSNTNIGCYIPRMSIAPDYTDATVPGSQAVLDQYESCQSVVLSSQTSFNTACVPKPSSVLFAGGMASGYGSVGGPNKMWLDSDSSTTVPHYAFKMWFRNFFTGAASGGNAIRIAPVLYFACREPR